MNSKQVVASFLLLCGLLLCGLWWNESQADVNEYSDVGLDGVFKEKPSVELTKIIPDTARAEGMGVDEFLAKVRRNKEPSAEGLAVDELLAEVLGNKESSAGAPLGAVKLKDDVYFADTMTKSDGSWFPDYTVGSLSFIKSQQFNLCTATVISRSFILTAGNCVHEGNGGNYLRDFKFLLHGETYVPVPGEWHTFDEWSRDGNLMFNFGWIKLQGTPGVDNPSANPMFNYDWMPIGDSDSLGLDPNVELETVGYPILDRNGVYTPDMFWTQCTPNIAVSEDYWFTDKCSTGYFSSGSPVYVWKDPSRTLYGVVFSHYNPEGIDFNLFVRLTESKYNRIQQDIESDLY